MAMLEGRFAPKDDYTKMAELLQSILKGFAHYHGIPRHQYNPAIHTEVPQTDKRMDLRLVAHFIKSDELQDSKRGTLCRYQSLRTRHFRQLRILVRLKERYRSVAHYLTGLDAAANELHTPPEVFSPLYRKARCAGFVHFTYHVGEDFEHLLSGIRACYEAATFLDLSAGDRIGHGTAIGIEPELWLSRSQRQIAKRKGDWLDDLVFAHALLDGGTRYPGLHGKLETQIAKLSQEIYRSSVSPTALEQAWQLRHLDPLIACNDSFDHLWQLSARERVEWHLVESARKEQQAAFDLMLSYHRPEVVERCLEPMLVERDLLSPEALIELQIAVINEFNRRQIAIECPPTSNVRISVYDDHKEHHLFRWLGLTRPDEPKPVVCLATDDPGIFATNMRNELIHLHQTLRQHFQLSEPQAMGLLDALSRQSQAYAFVNGSHLSGYTGTTAGH